MSQDYLYDVFISYRHRPPMLDWVKNHFYPLVEQRLPDCLPIDREPKIFIDWDSIETGSVWPLKLCQGLQTSRCMLSVQSPEYWRSPWCRAEWSTMRKRHVLLGIDDNNNTSSLIYPVVFADGKHFPPEAKQIQSKDLRNFNIPEMVFRETKDFVTFDREIQNICEEIAEMINTAPPWQEWPVVMPTEYENFSMEVPRI